MAESKIEKVSGKFHTFFTKRFDRLNGERVHFASAMTMTGNSEDTIRENPAGYLDIAQFIQNHSGNPQEDLHELWRRIVFNIAISNTDDHLRNHGFIIDRGSWRLSPAFDLNPSTDKEELALTIDETSGVLDFDIAMNVAPYFRLNKNEADVILSEVKTAVSNWEKVAWKTRILRNEIEMMRSAFR
jgi:serine/threonine-protein kinase HipA